jgi:hypothetical protein
MARFGDFDQYLDNAGDPLAEGKLYFYESGTTTPKTTYSDVNNSIPNTNPVLLSAAGRQPNIFFDGVAKVILTDNDDVQLIVRDPVGETATDFGDQWVATKIYNATDVVLGSDGTYYRSLINGNQNNNPVTTTGNWTLLYSVEWNAGITYQVGAVVTYDGEQYQSLQGSNLNQNPSTQTAYWVLLSFAWLATATYSDGQNAVGTDGILYTSLQDSNTGNDPATSPAYWVGTSAAAAASAVAAAASAAAALVSENAAAADAIATAADVVQTGLDAAATAADAIATAADRVQTGLDAAATAADVILTNADAVATAADRVQTGLDAAATSADAIATAADRVQTGLDVIATNADASSTAADAIATAADVVQTGLDVVATSADVVQTGLDVTAAATSASNAASSATASANSASAAAASYDAFDDRYLGDKASDPTLDNDGNALLTGALYFNTTSDVMKVYDGSAWNIAAISSASPTFTGTVTADGLVVNGAAVFNEGGGDNDFRVESDTNTQALFVEGSSGKVGINTTDLSGIFNVKTGSNYTNLESVFQVQNGNYGLGLLFSTYFDSGTDTGGRFISKGIAGSRGGFRFTAANGYYTGFQDVFRVSPSGYVTLYDYLGTANSQWDAINKRLGIGTTSPDQLLHIAASSNPTLRIENTDTTAAVDQTIGKIEFEGQDVSTNASGVRAEIEAEYGGVGGASRLRFKVTEESSTTLSDSIFLSYNTQVFSTGNTERMRIDSSGNLLVGTTNANNVSDGIRLKPDGFISAANTSGPVLYANRLSTDGAILSFQKNGTTVGSIGTGVGDVVVASRNNKGFKIYAPNADGTGAILHPSNDETGNPLDAKMNLGYSNGRFKDLYLSGGVYLGGTGAANQLDDYEEGTFTPSLSATVTSPTVTYSGQQGFYTKIGNVVRFSISIGISTYSGGSGNIQVQGLPFTSAASQYPRHFAFTTGVSFPSSRTIPVAYNQPSSTIMYMQGLGDNVTESFFSVTNFAAGDVLVIVGTYQV